MDAEEQIRRLKQIPPLTKEEKRKKIMTSIVLSISTLVSVLFLVFAFIQKQEADRQRQLAEEQSRMAIEAQVEADRQRQLAEEQRRMAMVAQLEAERQRKLAEETLAACEKRSKK